MMETSRPWQRPGRLEESRESGRDWKIPMRLVNAGRNQGWCKTKETSRDWQRPRRLVETGRDQGD